MSQNRFTIYTDSSSDILPPELLELKLERVKLYCNFINDNSPVNIDDLDDFYARVCPSNMAKTAAANPNDFIEAFEPALQAGDDVLYFGIPAALSGTFNSSQVAREELLGRYPGRDIICLDSGCICGGLRFLAQEVARRRDLGSDINDLAAFIQGVTIGHEFTSDNLDYFHAGGRISRAVEVAGRILNIQPVLHLNEADELTQRLKVRGTRRAVEELAKAAAEKIVERNHRVLISYAPGAKEKAELLATMLRSMIGDVVIEFSLIGPVIGAHCGPNTLALFYQATRR